MANAGACVFEYTDLHRKTMPPTWRCASLPPEILEESYERDEFPPLPHTDYLMHLQGE